MSGCTDIISLLKLCLDATHFLFRGVVYQQIHGTAMGSPASVVVANLVAEDVEVKAMNKIDRAQSSNSDRGS